MTNSQNPVFFNQLTLNPKKARGFQFAATRNSNEPRSLNITARSLESSENPACSGLPGTQRGRSESKASRGEPGPHHFTCPPAGGAFPPLPVSAHVAQRVPPPPSPPPPHAVVPGTLGGRATPSGCEDLGPAPGPAPAAPRRRPPLASAGVPYSGCQKAKPYRRPYLPQRFGCSCQPHCLLDVLLRSRP